MNTALNQPLEGFENDLRLPSMVQFCICGIVQPGRHEFGITYCDLAFDVFRGQVIVNDITLTPSSKCYIIHADKNVVITVRGRPALGRFIVPLHP